MDQPFGRSKAVLGVPKFRLCFVGHQIGNPFTHWIENPNICSEQGCGSGLRWFTGTDKKIGSGPENKTAFALFFSIYTYKFCREKSKYFWYFYCTNKRNKVRYIHILIPDPDANLVKKPRNPTNTRIWTRNSRLELMLLYVQEVVTNFI